MFLKRNKSYNNEDVQQSEKPHWMQKDFMLKILS